MTLEISKDEAAIYDRQIRVWGFEAQARMKNSSVLVLGTSGLSIEFMKNLVLAGVGQVIIVDEKQVELETLGSNFYLASTDQGRLRAGVCAEKLKLLNPKVVIQFKTQFTPELIEGQSLVCHTDATRAEMIKVNHLCREKGVKYISGNTFGVLGFLFFDLILHKHSVQESVHEARYVSLEQAFNTSLKKGTKKQLLRKISPTFLLNKVVLDFCNNENRRPSGSPEDLSKLNKMIEEFVQDVFPVQESLQKEILSHWNSTIHLYQVIHLIQGELAPCTAILGGILAQEGLKIVSGKDTPINNFFVYSGLDGEGLVHKLAPEA